MATKDAIYAELDHLDPGRLEALYQVVKQFAAEPPTPTAGDIMTKLRSIRIDAPADFSANLDAYVSGEKDGANHVH